MQVEKHREIIAPFAWRGADLEKSSDWIRRFSATELAEIDAALRGVQRRGLDWPDVTRDDFPLPVLSGELAKVAQALETGRGIVLLRGLPIERYSDDEIRCLYYGLGLHMGKPVRQNPRGELLGPVQNVGDVHDKNTRVYETNLFLPYHSDPSDVVGLLCVRQAKVGGLSSLVSVASIYNDTIFRFTFDGKGTPIANGSFTARSFTRHTSPPPASASSNPAVDFGQRLGEGARRSSSRAIRLVSHQMSAPSCSTGVRR